jgi:hypothetical protein
MRINKKVFVTATFGIFTLTLAACDGFEAKDEGLADLGKIEQRWDDGTAVAGHTGRNALSGAVQNLQAVKRDLESLKVSKCLTEAKGILIEIMATTNQEYLEFMGGANHTLTNKDAQVDAYAAARDKCSGKKHTQSVETAAAVKPAAAAVAAPVPPPASVPRGDYAQQLAAGLNQNMLHGPACDSLRQVISQIANNGMPENVRVAQLDSMEKSATRAHCLVE